MGLQNKGDYRMNASRQKGMSVLGWVMALLILGIVVDLGFKTMPHYLDFDSMAGLIETTPASLILNKSKRQIREALTKRFKINNLRDYKIADIVSIERDKAGTILNIHYVVTEHVAGNADLVMTFDKTFEFSDSRP